jgi:hypothetical protein
LFLFYFKGSPVTKLATTSTLDPNH